MRLSQGLPVCRRLALLVLPSVLLLLYLVLNDGSEPQAAERSTQIADAGHHLFISAAAKSMQTTMSRIVFSEQDLNKRISFSTAGDGDMMVFLHMQKTGGTFFGKNLVRNLQLETPCQCVKGDGMLKCPCMSSDRQRYWLFSRYSTGWKCGLHADYTELTECLSSGRLDQLEQVTRPRRYHYVSVLRDPSERYVSEWLHVAMRGASWYSSTLRCNGHSPSAEDLPSCHSGESWRNVTLTQFLDCPYNLARNRQTRMLANLSSVGCYSVDMMESEKKRSLLLASAKETLRSLPYFSIISYINESQHLFEQTFRLKFVTPFYLQKNRHNRNSSDILSSLTPDVRRRILEVNDLDVKLFAFAKQLFMQRYQYAIRDRSKVT